MVCLKQNAIFIFHHNDGELKKNIMFPLCFIKMVAVDDNPWASLAWTMMVCSKQNVLFFIHHNDGELKT